jgi:DNA-binding CsgD family transcriptional regulator
MIRFLAFQVAEVSGGRQSENMRRRWRCSNMRLAQIGTPSAYHGHPESHMKTQVAAPKCQCRKGLAVSEEEGKSFGRGRAYWRGESIVKLERREIIMVDLDQVKVTPRDQQVLNLLVQGCSNKEIAGQLNISPRTVKQHLRTLFLRAGIREGRKRVKLAIAVFAKEEPES